ncbi:MAG: glycosyltransferase family 2 protein [Rubripirellula sp.]
MTPDVAPVAEGFRKLSVLIPVYNEQKTLVEIIDRVLAVSIPLELEIVAVDDGSSDGSWELLQTLANRHPALVAIQHSENRGKGAAIRTAIEHVTGEIAVIQDADLEYSPEDYGKLLSPILHQNADATFGSRYCGESRKVLPFWHSMVNYTLTLFSNMLNNLTLTDMETCYKMVRSDLLQRLHLTSNTFTLEPELTARLAQAGARIYEVPVSYEGRNYSEGKKIGVSDGIKAIGQMLRCRFWDRRCYAETTRVAGRINAGRAASPQRRAA